MPLRQRLAAIGACLLVLHLLLPGAGFACIAAEHAQGGMTDMSVMGVASYSAEMDATAQTTAPEHSCDEPAAAADCAGLLLCVAATLLPAAITQSGAHQTALRVSTAPDLSPVSFSIAPEFPPPRA